MSARWSVFVTGWGSARSESAGSAQFAEAQRGVDETGASRGGFGRSRSDLAPGAAAADRQYTQKVMPAAIDAGLDHIGIEVVATVVVLVEIGLGRDAAAVRRQPRPEDVGDEDEVDFFANRAEDAARCAEILGRPDQFGMSVAQLITTETTAAVVVDQSETFQPVVDDGPTAGGGAAAKCIG